MAVSDILEQYANVSPGVERADAANDYGAVAPFAPREIVKAALAEAFRSGQSGPFPELVSGLFRQCNPEQRAGLLRILLEAVGPGAVTDGVLSRVPGRVPERPYEITARDAEKVQSEQIRQLAVDAEKRNPTIVDIVSGFFVNHPDVIKTLAHATLAIALHEIGKRVRK